MRPSPPKRATASSAGLLLVLAAPALFAQSATPSLPPNAPTQSFTTGTAGPVSNAHNARRADVDYTGGLLHIAANNSSLNQILREVARLTGMKITGGVAEDRVFGTYGPAPASIVLSSLLDGTASNVLIVQNASSGPAELILTPRRGEPTPPSPNSGSDETDPDRDVPQQPGALPQQNNRRSQHPTRRSLAPDGLGALPPSNGGQTNPTPDGGADLGTIPGAFKPYGETPPDATAQPVTDSQQIGPTNAASTPGDTSGGGAVTPQQIYEQLQRLRQQQQQQQQQQDQQTATPQ